MLIKDIEETDEILEGKMYCEAFNCNVDVVIGSYSENPEALLPYAQKCAQDFNSMSKKLVAEICDAAKRFYLTFIDEISEDWKNEIEENISVSINADTDASEILKCFTMSTLSVEEPSDERIGYCISGSCEWDSEHGIEIAILDGKLVYLGPVECTDPWKVDCDAWNFSRKQ